jgi:GAF domain-containing protein
MPKEPPIQHLAEDVLALLNRKGNWDDLITEIVLLVKKELGFEAVGLRLNDGIDFPYFVSRGFSDDFIAHENYLCARDNRGSVLHDTDGNAVMECMCGNVIQGRTDPRYPFFTPFGSFWSNGTTELLAGTSDSDRQARTRNRCNGEGYESVGLFPIRAAGVTHGLLQLNDRRTGMFSPSLVEFVEGLGSTIGLLFSLKKKEEDLARQKADVSRLVGVRTRELAMASEKLMAEIGRGTASGNPEAIGMAAQLQAILDEIKILKGILPICCMCKRIRDEDGYWRNLENFIHDRTGADFSHGICPECYPEIARKLDLPPED